jgi:RNA polymerase sigma-70 factor (ECF subfamily)
LAADRALSDEELFERFRAFRDERAFAELVHRHEDRLFALATRMLSNRHDALDAVQDAFIFAYRRAGSFRGDSSFGTWLYRIAINSCTDVLRRRARSPQPVEQSAETSGRAPAPVEATVERVDLERALEALQREFREAVILHDLLGVPHKEIAAALGIPVGTVKSRISRGRLRLAEMMEPGRRRAPSKEQR